MPLTASTSIAIAYPCLGPAARLTSTRTAGSAKRPRPPMPSPCLTARRSRGARRQRPPGAAVERAALAADLERPGARAARALVHHEAGRGGRVEREMDVRVVAGLEEDVQRAAVDRGDPAAARHLDVGAGQVGAHRLAPGPVLDPHVDDQ